MRPISIGKGLYRISSRKFYEVVREKHERLIPSTPQEIVISKYLKSSQPSIQRADSMIRKNKKNQSSEARGVNYKEIIQSSPYGSVSQQNYKDLTLSLVSLNYKNIQLKDIYQLCEKLNPDLVLVQAKPENYLAQFELLPKKNDVFSDVLYLQQLILESPQIKKQVLSEEISSYFDTLIKGIPNEMSSKVYINDTKGIVQDEAILTAAHYAAQNNKQLMIGQLPEQPWRQWICNSHSLMELQELFKLLCKNMPFYQSLSLSPEKLGCLIQPQLFLNLKDRYMATLIEMLVATKQYKRVLGIFGPMQNQSILQIFEKDLLMDPETDAFTPMLQYLIGPPIKSSVMRNVQGWEVIEKHIILDIMKHGKSALNIPVNQLAVTNRVIEHYGVELNNYSRQNIKKFRYDKTIEYLQIIQEQIQQGQELKKKIMLREAIRNNQNDSL